MAESENTLFIDGFFWSRHFEQVFCRPVYVFIEAVEKRLLPTFDNIEAEATAVANDEWERFMTATVGPDDCVDPGDFADQAQDAGIEYCESLANVKQSLLNLSAVTLHHMFEQQMLFFYRKEVLDLRAAKRLEALVKKNLQKAKERLEVGTVMKCLKGGGINLHTLNAWVPLNELRLVANTIKHADGISSEQLRAKRPELFIHPRLRDRPDFMKGHLPLYQPAAGEDLYLTLDDLKVYGEAVQQFWREFGEVILERSQKRRCGE